MKPKVTTEIENGIARIQMDDGKVNAMSIDLMESIGAALNEAEAAGAVAVLRGREGIFSAGFDLKTFQRDPAEGVAMVRTGAELILRFLRFPLPILTVCTGHAYPMGAFLMLSADARWGLRGPFRIGMNETAIRITVPKFAVELARHRLAPPAFSRVNAAMLFSPDDARLAGYLDAVVEAAELDAAVRAEATRLRQLDMRSFKGTKARVNEPVIRAIEAALGAEMRQVAGTGA